MKINVLSWPVTAAALNMFVSIFGAVSGNLALTAMTTGGVYIGGGIAPKILSELKQKRFMSAFSNLEPLNPRILESFLLNNWGRGIKMKLLSAIKIGEFLDIF